MASEDHLIQGAAKAIGETILVAGMFQPKGLMAEQEIGDVVGSAVGNQLGGFTGSLIGAVGGIATADVAGSKDGTDAFVVAISETTVYVLAPASVRGVPQENLELLHTFPREHLSATIHARVGVRILVLENVETGEVVKLEGSRVSWSHSKDVIHVLSADGPQGETAKPATS